MGGVVLRPVVAPLLLLLLPLFGTTPDNGPLPFLLLLIRSARM